MAYTYENADSKYALETYEWDNAWLDHSNDKKTPCVFYIGDSISCGTRGLINEKTEGTLRCDGFGTSKAVDNPFFAEAVKLFAGQRGKYDLVLFNNGLHGWHLEDSTEYAEYYEKLVCCLKEFFAGAVFAIVLTTDVRGDEERSVRVVKRNDAARSIAEKYSLPVIDLFTMGHEINDPQHDGVHFTREGNNKMADFLIEAAKKLLSGKI